ncbi:MAG: secretin N-terminal domain-containing protein [Candidatus Babeliales bacterium]
MSNHHKIEIGSLFCVLLLCIPCSLVSYTRKRAKSTLQAETMQGTETQSPIDGTHAAYPVQAQRNDEKLFVSFDAISGSDLLTWMSTQLQIVLITQATVVTGKESAEATALHNSKFTFSAPQALTKKEIWDLFTQWLELMGLTITHTRENIYSIKPSARKELGPVTTLLNLTYEQIPDSNEQIRYIYFFKNSQITALMPVIDQCKSTLARVINLEQTNGFIIDDYAVNIRALMKIIQQLDEKAPPEVLSILHLKNIDAEDVVKLYQQIMSNQPQTSLERRFYIPKTNFYFANTVQLFAESRSNTLVIMGPRDAVRTVENFVIKQVDLAVKFDENPIHVYELQHVQADDMKKALMGILKNASQNNIITSSSVLTEFGKTITVESEPSTNCLLVYATDAEYEHVKKIIADLDIPQPQIAVEILLVSTSRDLELSLGSQIRNPLPTTISKHLDFQTSGLPLVISNAAPLVDTTTNSLRANLVSLAANEGPGVTVLTVGNSTTNGVWAIFEALQTLSSTTILANPFILTTNKKTAKLSIGQTRRVITTTFTSLGVATPAFADIDANLNIQISSRINALGLINIDLALIVDTFTNSLNPQSANKDIRSLSTNAQLGDGQVLAVGGLRQLTKGINAVKVPILGDIPILSWFFKSEDQSTVSQNLMVFITAHIIETKGTKGTTYANAKIQETSEYMQGTYTKCVPPRDPIHKHFFNENKENTDVVVRNFEKHVYGKVPIDVPPLLECSTACHVGRNVIDTSASVVTPVSRTHGLISFIPDEAYQRAPA